MKHEDFWKQAFLTALSAVLPLSPSGTTSGNITSFAAAVADCAVSRFNERSGSVSIIGADENAAIKAA